MMRTQARPNAQSARNGSAISRAASAMNAIHAIRGIAP